MDPNHALLKEIIKRNSKRKTSKAVGFGDIYDDVAPKVSSGGTITASAAETDEGGRLIKDITIEVKLLLDRICNREGLNLSANALQGNFKRLMDKDTFCETVYPGLSEASIAGLPHDIFSLINRGNTIHSELVTRIPKISEAALSVLEGVRRRGAERGDSMDRATETILIPQIVGESFSLAVIEVIRALNSRASAAYAQSFLVVADPMSVAAT